MSIVEKASKTKLQVFVHGLDSIIYADTQSNIIIVCQPERITQINLTPNFTESKIASLMKVIYTEIINEKCSN